MSEGGSSSRVRSRSKRWIARVLTPAGALAVLAFFVLNATAASACCPPPSSSPTVLATIPLIDAIAATPQVVYIQGVQNCSQIWAVNSWGGVSAYATVPVPNSHCTEGSLVVAPYSNCNSSSSWSPGQEAGVRSTDASASGAWGNGGGGGGCNPCHQQNIEVLYDVVGGSLFRIMPGGTNVTYVANFTVPYGAKENLGLAYDSVGMFNHSLIVTSSQNGMIWLVNATSGAVTDFAELNTYIAGPAIAPSWFGTYGGDLFIAENKKGTVDAITSTDSSSVVANWARPNAVTFPSSSGSGGSGGCGGGGGGCSFGQDHDVLFVANYTSGALEAYPASALQNFAGMGMIAGGHNHGIGAFDANGTTSLFAGQTQRLSDITFITCPPGGGSGGWGGW
jgi:hypothetical protein